MNKCLMCGSELHLRLDLKWLLSFQPLVIPVVCHQCRQQFKTLKNHEVCPGCGRFQRNKELCLDCQRWQKMGEHCLLNNRALYRYDEVMKGYMQRYKFHGDYEQRLIFQGEFTAAVCQVNLKSHLLVPIPVDDESLKTRGFNQVTALLKNVEFHNLLSFKKQTGRVKQSTKTRKDRMETEQPFEYNGQGKLSGQKILLLDDIYTTGRTLYHAKHILQSYGAGEIHSLTLAR